MLALGIGQRADGRHAVFGLAAAVTGPGVKAKSGHYRLMS